MISLSPITSPGPAAGYYRRDDYYCKNQESPSAWHGRGAEALGLSGAVGKEEFTGLLDGRLPDGTTLGRINSEGQREHIPGYDLTLSAPKSVSVAALVGGDDRLIDAHEQAVKTTLDWIEREAAATRVKVSGETHRENTGNLAIATFRHETSRAQDPQLHTHCVVINATYREDGKWRSLEGREIYRVRALADRIYQSELAVRAKALGYQVEIDQERGRMELAAVPQEVREHFSQRSQAIGANLAEKGKTRETASTKQREVSCLSTRDAKVELDRDHLTQHWQERAAAFRARDLEETINSRFFGVASRAEIDRAIADLKGRGELISKPVASLWNSRELDASYTTKAGQQIERQPLAAVQRGRVAIDQDIAIQACDKMRVNTDKAGDLFQAVSERTGEKEVALDDRKGRGAEPDQDHKIERFEREVELER
ncbi:MAG: MobF family relaxase [Desulfobacca sp.]|nr:MobF family relaxase [Desulfobacca sp.]